MIVPVMVISNLVLTRQIYSEETNGAHAYYREPVPLRNLLFGAMRACGNPIWRLKMASLSTRFEVPFLRNQRITEHHSLGIFLKLCLKFPIIEKKSR